MRRWYAANEAARGKDLIRAARENNRIRQMVRVPSWR